MESKTHTNPDRLLLLYKINIRIEIDYKRSVGQYSLMKPTEKGCVKPHKNV